MSRPLSLPIRLLSQNARQSPSTQCLRQRSTGYASLSTATFNTSTTTTTRQQRFTAPSKRAFTTTPRCQAAVRPQMRQPSQPSLNRSQQEQQDAMMRSGQFPDDIGLLPDTFVLPRNADRWSWRLRKKWLKVRFVDAYSFLAFKYFLVKPKPQFDLRQLPSKAAAIHKEMYSAFAAGDLNPMTNKVCAGLLGSLRGRVAQRAPNTYLRWSIKKQLAAPKLVSFKAAVLPGPQGEAKEERNAQVQAVVRLHTLQTLQHVKKTTKRSGRELKVAEELEGPEEEKESVEYVVLQKTLRRGKMNPWRVWGFTNETDLKQVELEDKK
ncbi:hypothetical protein Q7P37_006515 [Cladosporium fusiforme]